MKGQPERLLWFRLARDVLHTSVARAQLEVDSREFTEWIAFQQMEPSYYVLFRWSVAWIVCWMKRLWGSTRVPNVRSCMLEFEEPKSPAELEARMQAWSKNENAKRKLREELKKKKKR